MHQIVNAGTAIACLEQLPQLPLPPAAIADGLRHIDWPARMQRLHHGPLIDLLPAGWELWLAGGHNPSPREGPPQGAPGWGDPPPHPYGRILKTKDVRRLLSPPGPQPR